MDPVVASPQVTASDGQLSTSTSLNVRVAKLPQSGLRFTQDKYFGRVDEESSAVSRVVLVQAIGSDLNEHLTYRLLTPTPHFMIGETSGVLQTTSVPFDREEESNYHLLVEVSASCCAFLVVFISRCNFFIILTCLECFRDFSYPVFNRYMSSNK